MIRQFTHFNFKELNQFDKIYCLVSGGIDSTYALELCYQNTDESKIIPLNCFNPYEQSETLTQISEFPNYMQIKPDLEYNYGDILKNAFLQLPAAKKLKDERRYHKKIFRCCYYIKHKSFLNDPLFKTPNTSVISGIKYGDGQQRRFWLTHLFKEHTYFHLHKSGQFYCYPFRDYKFRELPLCVISELRKKYPTLRHSGCSICPILVLFPRIKKDEPERYERSLQYAIQLGVANSRGEIICP